MVTDQIRMAFFSIALPALSSLQGDNRKFGDYFNKFVCFVSWATMPMAAACFVFADDIVLLYYGKQWVNAAFYMKIFSLKAFFMPALTTLDQVPLALGYSKRYLAAGMMRSIVAIIFISTGAFMYGVKGAAIGVATVDMAILLPFFLICTKHSGIRLKNYMITVLIPMIATIAAGAVFLAGGFHQARFSVVATIADMILFAGLVAALFGICDYFNIGTPIGITRKMLDKLGWVK
jgi:PST family polysaccharide transporter